jgi:hypothetical protein
MQHIRKDTVNGLELVCKLQNTDICSLSYSSLLCTGSKLCECLQHRLVVPKYVLLLGSCSEELHKKQSGRISFIRKAICLNEVIKL